MTRRVLLIALQLRKAELQREMPGFAGERSPWDRGQNRGDLKIVASLWVSS